MAGADVTIASRSQERLSAALAGLPDGCAAEAVDSNDEDGIAALFERVGELDHLVYTAGGPLDPHPRSPRPRTPRPRKPRPIPRMRER